MESGAITGYIDVAQIVLYAFWIFFAGLIYYLLQEGKREGYPLDSDRTERSGGKVKVVGYPEMPSPKTYLMRDGRTVVKPNPDDADAREPNAQPAAAFPGAPFVPNGDPMLAAVGPGSFAERADVPDLANDDRPKIVPMRTIEGVDIHGKDPDPRGMSVLGLDNAVAGTVRDVWVDRMEHMIRYLELELAGGESRTVLLPMNFARVHPPRQLTKGDFAPGHVKVRSLLGEQFAGVPVLASEEQITLLEEEKIAAYYGAGTLYATPGRAEPLL